MSESVLMYIFLAVIFAVAAYVLYIHPRAIERKTREPLSAFLDKLIAQVTDVNKTPLGDLAIHVMTWDDGRVERIYWVYPYLNPFMFYRFRKGVTERYEVGYSSSHASNFTTPFSCRSAWFTDRLKRLSTLLDNYPRERTRSYRALHPSAEDTDLADRVSDRPSP